MVKQERLQEIPTGTATASDGNLHAGAQEHFATALPGSEHEYSLHPNAQVHTVRIYLLRAVCWLDILDQFHNPSYFQGSEFLRGFRSMDQSMLSDVWDDIQRPQVPHFQGRTGPSNYPLEQPRLQQDFEGNFGNSLSLLEIFSLQVVFAFALTRLFMRVNIIFLYIINDQSCFLLTLWNDL